MILTRQTFARRTPSPGILTRTAHSLDVLILINYFIKCYGLNSRQGQVIRQSRHIQPAPRTIYLLFLTQFVVRVCVGTFFAEMAKCRLTESSPLLCLTPPWSLNVASPAKSPSSSPETMHTFSIFCLVNLSSLALKLQTKILFLIFPALLYSAKGRGRAPLMDSLKIPAPRPDSL